LLEGGEEVLSVKRWSVVALAMPKSMTLGTGTPSWSATRMLEGLISRWMMPFLVRVLNGLADLNEKLQARHGAQVVLIAVIRDFDAAHQFHDEIRAGPSPSRRRPAPFAMFGVVHQRQRLPLGFKAGDHVLGVHAELDDFERDPAANRLLLFGHVNHTAAPFANLLQQFVAADAVTGLVLTERLLVASLARLSPAQACIQVSGALRRPAICRAALRIMTSGSGRSSVMDLVLIILYPINA
jgi:hypothetical protein